jgi:DNA-binding CsgD family transcriptional regulator
MNPCFAIIDSNTLECTSLRNILWEVFDGVEIHAYDNMDAFIRDSNRHFVHFFVSSDIIFTCADEFETLKDQTTVISSGANRLYEEAGFNILDTTLPELELVQGLSRLQATGKYGQAKPVEALTNSPIDKLSSREKEVLRLMIKGHINKEIANMLEISLPTAIFHRNNICIKLKTRSIGKMTVYAVMSGMIDINEI